MRNNRLFHINAIGELIPIFERIGQMILVSAADILKLKALSNSERLDFHNDILRKIGDFTIKNMGSEIADNLYIVNLSPLTNHVELKPEYGEQLNYMSKL